MTTSRPAAQSESKHSHATIGIFKPVTLPAATICISRLGNGLNELFRPADLGLVFITDCPPNSTLYRRRSSLPSCRCSCLEQSATARHFCTFSSRLFISAENPLRFLPRTILLYSACEVTSSLLDTLIDHLTYVLTQNMLVCMP